jgi:hypothetical protein
MHRRLTHLRKKRNKRKKGSILAFLMTRCFGFTRFALWRIDVAPFPHSPSLDTSTSPSSPFPLLYRDIGMVMMSKQGMPG